MSDRTNLVGMEISRYSVTVERGKIREMALAIGDGNLLYADPDYARSQGCRDIIAPPTYGTCIDLWGGLSFSDLCQKLQMNPVKVLHGEQEYVYMGKINPGDQISASRVLKNLVEKEKMYIFNLESTYRNQSGEVVLISRSTLIERK